MTAAVSRLSPRVIENVAAVAGAAACFPPAEVFADMRLSKTIERPRDAAAERVRKPRRAVKIATKATRTIYRIGRGVGRLSARWAQPLTPAKAGAAFAAGAATGAGTAFLLDSQHGARRRHVARDKLLKLGRRGAREASRKSRYAAGIAKGAAVEAAGAGDGTGDLNDPALARKVESEIFRDPDAPKGEVNLQVVDGVVELRGAVDDPAWAERLASQAREIESVREVRNLIATRSGAAARG
jgi:osmotically-inducible protein OsmY